MEYIARGKAPVRASGFRPAKGKPVRDGTLYSGRLAPKGTKGVKFQLFLDETSDDAFSADVAERGALVSARSAGSVLGQSGKLVLKLLEDGSVSLKIKREVLAANVGEVVFKANLAQEAPAQP